MMIVKVVGLRRLERTLDRIINNLVIEYRRAMAQSVALLERDASVYPPESGANHPKYGAHGPFYIRGRGSAYQRQDGKVTVYPTSERLGDSWVNKVVATATRIVGTTSPRASYGPYVVGAKQARFHRARKWPTLVGTVARLRGKVVGLFRGATRRVVGR